MVGSGWGLGVGCVLGVGVDLGVGGVHRGGRGLQEWACLEWACPRLPITLNHDGCRNVTTCGRGLTRGRGLQRWAGSRRWACPREGWACPRPPVMLSHNGCQAFYHVWAWPWVWAGYRGVGGPGVGVSVIVGVTRRWACPVPPPIPPSLSLRTMMAAIGSQLWAWPDVGGGALRSWRVPGGRVRPPRPRPAPHHGDVARLGLGRLRQDREPGVRGRHVPGVGGQGSGVREGRSQRSGRK